MTDSLEFLLSCGTKCILREMWADLAVGVRRFDHGTRSAGRFFFFWTAHVKRKLTFFSFTMPGEGGGGTTPIAPDTALTPPHMCG